ncbi:MAG: hypothetical protein SGI77_10970 [Pirellulaceae bacterium]|nr:hypothetical protein [Pirellulaceae bacterium]
MTSQDSDYSQSIEKPWHQIARSPALVLGILFLVTGSLGLPLLWYSPAFSKSSKCFWSIVVTIYTLLLIAITIAIVWWAYSTISRLY